MSECTDKQLGRLLHAWELGMLSPSDQDALEAHLIDCPYCQKEARHLLRASELLRDDPALKPFLKDLSGRVTDIKRPQADKTVETSRRTRLTYLWRAAAVAAVVVLVLTLKPWDIEFHPTHEAIAAENRVVVMCINNLPQEEDRDWMSDAITNLLISDLSESRYVQVVANLRLYEVLKRLGVTTLHNVDGEFISDVGRETRARFILLCNILQAHPQIMLTAQLMEVSSGDVVASHRLEHDGDVFTLVDSLTVLVKNDLSLPPAARQEYDPSIADVTTRSAEAYRWYLEGVENYGRKYFKEAEECYKMAVRYDSTFAMAHYCLVYHGVPGALERAVKYSKNATYKEQLYIRSLQASREGDTRRAEELLKELVQRYPDEKIAWMELAYYAKTDRRYEEAVHYLQRSLEADPYYGDGMSS
ncbi:MAG: zf-HC2 domain-containing protein, partial [candidate division Zixibacteria bacterium]|nr:zf-HC2 domain-containing protein [candidate division Zixibacteria bacterium]